MSFVICPAHTRSHSAASRSFAVWVGLACFSASSISIRNDAPLQLGAVRAYLPAHQYTGSLKRPEHRVHLNRAEVVARGRVAGWKRTPVPGVAPEELLQRLLDGDQEAVGQARCGDCTECIAIEARILGGYPTRVAGDLDLDCTPLCLEIDDPLAGFGGAAQRKLVRGQVAEPSQEIVDLVGIPRSIVVGQVLQLRLELCEYLPVDEIAQLGLAEQFGQ